MGCILFTEKPRPKTAKERVLSQENIKKALYCPRFNFQLDEDIIEEILAIPLTDYHMRLTREEVAQIIHERLNMSLKHAGKYAIIISQTSSKKISRGSLPALLAQICIRSYYVVAPHRFRVRGKPKQKRREKRKRNGESR